MQKKDTGFTSPHTLCKDAMSVVQVAKLIVLKKGSYELLQPHKFCQALSTEIVKVSFKIACMIAKEKKFIIIIFRENIEIIPCIFLCPLVFLGLQGQQLELDLQTFQPAPSGDFVGGFPRCDQPRSST